MNPIDPNAAGPASGGQPLQQESYAGQGQPKRRGWAAQPLDSSGCPPGAERAEWIEADGLGGFASGTVSGVRSRRYHALLLTATTPPAGRMVLVNGFDAWVETPRGTFAISSQRYGPDVIHPDGASRIESFEYEPWPRWRYKIDNLVIEQELFVPKGESAIFMSWKLVSPNDADLKLKVRPFLSGRDFHSTHHENGAFRFYAEQIGERVRVPSLKRLPWVIADWRCHYSARPALL